VQSRTMDPCPPMCPRLKLSHDENSILFKPLEEAFPERSPMMFRESWSRSWPRRRELMHQRGWPVRRIFLIWCGAPGDGDERSQVNEPRR
jgi:hypothetical protein